VTKADVFKAVDAEIRSTDGYIFGVGRQRTPLNDSSRSRVAVHLARKVEAYASQSGISIEAAAGKIYKGAIASGEIEAAGAFGWVNPKGAKPLARLMGQPDTRVDEATTAIVDTKLKQAGYAAGASGGNYTVTRLADHNGEARLYIQAIGDDGTGNKDIFVTSTEMQHWLTAKATKEVQANQPGAPYKPDRLMRKVINDNQQAVADFNK
jgi:hypothetical protein